VRFPFSIPAIALGLAAALGAVLPAASAQTANAREPKVRPAVERIDVVPGRPLVLPIEIVDDRVLRRGVFEAVLDDGLKIEGEIHWIGVRPARRPTGHSPGRVAWLGPAVEWVSIPAREAARDETRPPGLWYLVCEMPPEAVGLGMWFAGERSAVNWLPDPWRLGRDANGRVPEAMWASPLPEGAVQAGDVRAALAQLMANPWTRWRARLMLGSLEPDASFADHWSPPPGLSTSEPTGVLAKLAAYQDGLWQAALARLWIGDKDEAVVLRARLGQVSAFEGGWAPTFPVSSVAELNLRTDLLNPFVNEKTLGLRAPAWRASQPAAAVWVVDDSGRTDATLGSPVATVGAIVLGNHNAPTALLTLGDQPPEPVEPRRELRRVLSAENRGAGDSPRDGERPDAELLRTRVVAARVGLWKGQLQILTGSFPAAPPSVPLGPLVNDWTLGAWSRGRELEGAAVVPDSMTSVRLLRAGSSASDWRVLIECRTPEGDTSTAADPASGPTLDEVTLWFGPRSSPRVVRRVNSRGQVRGGTAGEALETVPVASGSGGWTVMVAVPTEAIERGGLLRVGLTRTDPVGRRTAWPRRMLPWDSEPGRLAVDLNAWDGF
jgi:hypothetical protein